MHRLWKACIREWREACVIVVALVLLVSLGIQEHRKGIPLGYTVLCMAMPASCDLAVVFRQLWSRP